MKSDMFEQLVQISHKALADGHHSVACHALFAAYHCAQVERSSEHLLQVEDLAGEYLRQIDACAPECEHSSCSSIERGQVNVFTAMAHQASITAACLKKS
jgi:hypothetical protein